PIPSNSGRPNDAPTAPARRPGHVLHRTGHGRQLRRLVRRGVVGRFVGLLGKHLRPGQGRAPGARRRGRLRCQRRPDPRGDAGGCAPPPARCRSARAPGQRHGACTGDPGAVNLGAGGATRPRRVLPWLAGWLLACATTLHAAPQLQLDGEALTPPQAEAAREVLDAAVRRLPRTWADALDPGIVVEWRDDLPPDIHGRLRGERLLLRRTLLDDWIARGAGGDANPATRPALAAVIHELAHVHDRSPRGGLSRDPRLLDLAG